MSSNTRINTDSKLSGALHKRFKDVLPLEIRVRDFEQAKRHFKKAEKVKLKTRGNPKSLKLLEEFNQVIGLKQAEKDLEKEMSQAEKDLDREMALKQRLAEEIVCS